MINRSAREIALGLRVTELKSALIKLAEQCGQVNGEKSFDWIDEALAVVDND